MSIQTIHWALFVIPWLTIFLVRKEDIKRYMPATLFATILSTLIHDSGITLGIWTLHETVFPLHGMTPYLYGSLAITALWVLKFTYGRFWLYMATNIILDIGFVFLFLGKLLPAKGILSLNVPPLQALPITLIHAVLIYGYQVWQEGVFIRSESKSYSSILQPAAAKPSLQDEEQKKN